MEYNAIMSNKRCPGHRSDFSMKLTDSLVIKIITVTGPVIQASGRLIFEDDLRSGGLLCFNSMNASIRTELADSMVTPGGPGGD